MDIHHDYSGNQIGKYYLIHKLGNGGFGAVYKAFDVILKAEKAVKILEVNNPQKAFQLFTEASIPYKCRHNNIIRINSGEIIQFQNELVFVVDMELVNGESIDSLLRHTYISVIDSLNIMRDILFAVEYSHLQGVIHRDIKPANILIDNGIPKLSDFGLSVAMGDEINPQKWYITHAAPEIFVDNSNATIQTDIYALGITMYRMTNGITDWNLLLRGITNANLLMKSGKLMDNLPVAPYVPNKVSKIIKKACKRLPEDRYGSAMEMRNAIEKLCPVFNWKMIEDDFWKGVAIGHPIKEIYFEYKRNQVSVIVTNNGRKSSQDSKGFTDIIQAKKYMMDYIRNTTLK